jgi:hypothetical protein
LIRCCRLPAGGLQATREVLRLGDITSHTYV